MAEEQNSSDLPFTTEEIQRHIEWLGTASDNLDKNGQHYSAEVVVKAKLMLQQTIRGWRPIETAPKDKTPILVWQSGRIYHAMWGGQFHNTWVSATLDLGFYDGASHWMPLPDPPC